ncbi:hypothetical protein CPAV1605_305 [seawater metagenome]|uniref:Uncharacterized protein n=1 Tax=seawater metagenome TaxID=1561972 RepID=A0A5E8CLX5_9ZZZZ
MSENDHICLKISLGFSAFCINLSFLIAGGIICKETDALNSSDEEFHLAWVCNLVLTCISGVGALSGLCGCCGIFDNEDNRNKSNDTANLINTIGLGVTIWAFVMWFQELNLQDFENEYYSLFMLMQIRVYFSLAIFGIIVLIIMGVCCGGCYHLCKNDNEETEIYRPSSPEGHRTSDVHRTSEV